MGEVVHERRETHKAVDYNVEQQPQKNLQVEIDFFGRSIETRGYCRSANSESADDFRNYIYWIILAVLNVVSILVAFYSAYKAKDMDDKLAESRSIFFALGVLVVASFVGIPVLLICANENSE